MSYSRRHVVGGFNALNLQRIQVIRLRYDWNMHSACVDGKYIECK